MNRAEHDRMRRAVHEVEQTQRATAYTRPLIPVPVPPRMQRIRLLEDLYPCEEAEAEIILFGPAAGSGSSGGSDASDGLGPINPCCNEAHAGDQITVGDPLGVIRQLLNPSIDDQGLEYLPAGSYAYAAYFPDSQLWELVAAGDATCNQEGSGSGSGSGGSGSGGSGSGSGSGGSGSGSEGSGSGSSGSEKSTAIVPASWSPGGHTALFVEEAPEVWFHDIMEVETSQPEAAFIVDARFIEVCEKGSLRVTGCVPREPVCVGAAIDPACPTAIEHVRLRIRGAEPGELIHVTVRLTGVRLGFAGLRFPDRTRAQFEANERFIKAAHQ